MNHVRFNRRRLLKGAAAAAAAPYVITSTALGNADTPPASERITLGHIGMGGNGQYFFSFCQQCKGAQSVAVADAYKSKRDAFARFIKGKAYGDFREFSARGDIDAVVVCTPDHWHVPIAIAAARAKKDAMVTKPLGLTIEQDLACLKVFSETGRVFQYGTQQRSSHFSIAGLDASWSAAGGSEKSTPSKWLPPTAAPVDRRRSFHSARSRLRHVVRSGAVEALHSRPLPRAGNLLDLRLLDRLSGRLGAHPLDIMVWGSDADIADPTITVEGTGTIPNAGLYDTVLNWDMKIQLGDGVKMTFKPGGDATKFIGHRGLGADLRGGIDAEPKSLLTSKIGPSDVHLVDSPNHCQSFLDSIKSRKPPVSPLDQAVRSDVISHLCNIAVRTGRKITWDTKKMTIVGNEGAARMMHRDMRAPWTI